MQDVRLAKVVQAVGLSVGLSDPPPMISKAPLVRPTPTTHASAAKQKCQLEIINNLTYVYLLLNDILS